MNSNTPQNYLGLLRHHSGLLAIVFLAVFTGNLGQSFFIGLFQVPISQHLNLSASEFGNIYAIITIAGGFLVIHFGPKIDWVPPRQYALFVLGALTIGLLLLTLSPWWILGILGLGLLRLSGQGLMTHLGSTLTAREFTINRGRALGIISLAMPSGEIILPSLTALLLLWLSWQQVWWCILVFLIILWLYLFIFVDWPDAPQEKKDANNQHIHSLNPMRELRFWLLIPMLLVLPMTLTGIFIFQAQLTHDLGANTSTYALALTTMGLIRFPIALLGGRWIDELGVSLLARLYLLPYAVALLTAALIGGSLGIWVLMLGAGIAMSMSTAVGDSLLVSLWGKQHLGRVRSLKSAFLVFSTGITPALLGFSLDLGVHFQSILISMLLFLIIAWLLAQAPIQQAQQQL
ncbi:MAG: MFS transporter [Gammaproteobacteria bacterium]|nr:MAG: MFS transporter [Gammaproteobacteria bacterium]RKZ98225.1 MAG: MFS transporter [Gammaproteobacteria bacterium]